MNVIFHTLTGTAVAGVFAAKAGDRLRDYQGLWVYLLLFVLTVLGHGLLDVLPHQYPFTSRIDIGMSLAFFALVVVVCQPKFIFLFAVAFFGSVFPDLVDLGPQMLNQHFGTSLPALDYKVFPWHRPEYSGSIFTHNLNQLSNFLHLLVAFITTAAISVTFDKYSRFGRK